MTMTLRALTVTDADRVAQLNNAAIPAVPFTDPEGIVELLGLSDHAFGVEADNAELVGFVIAMDPGGSYASENYRYFESRGVDHLYVDRIVVDTSHRGAGVGRRLYDHVFALAAQSARRDVTCEVNVEPPNPESLAFHARLGFVEVARQATKADTVHVALLAADVLRYAQTSGRGVTGA